MKSFFTVVALLTLVFASLSNAQEEIGEGFARGTRYAGFSLAIGIGTDNYGSNQAHDLALGRIHCSWIIGDVIGKDRWFQGNFELVAEAFGGFQYNPDDRHLYGLTLLPRYSFATGTRWIPFVQAGLGVTGTNIRGPDLSTYFQFNDQFGVGTHYALRRDLLLTLEYRFLHLSNAGIDQPNDGVNSHMISIGMSRLF
jgi:lipid A 3-O-deacylase